MQPAYDRKPPQTSLICWNCSSFDVRPNPAGRYTCEKCKAVGDRDDFRGVPETARIVGRKWGRP